MPYTPAPHNLPGIVNGADSQTPAPGATALSATFITSLLADLLAYVQSELSSVGSYVDQSQSNPQAANYQFVLADVGRTVVGTGASAQTFTMPLHSTVAFPVKSLIVVGQYGAGQITLAGVAGVTLRAPAGRVKSTSQYSFVSLWQYAQDEWWLGGDLA